MINFEPMPPFNPSSVEKHFLELGIKLKCIRASELMQEALNFKKYLLKDREWMNYYHNIISDKWIEHFLSWYFLKPSSGDTVLDVASHWSPYYRIIRKVSGVKVYQQDICFNPGIHGFQIGSDCTSIPLPDNSVDCIALNNSLEHFEEDKDSLFFKEAYRLLKPGGRICISPLFINNVSVNMSDPEADLTGLKYDANAVLVSGYPLKIRFARFYTPQTYLQRLIKVLPAFKHEIVSIRDMVSFDPQLNYWQFVSDVHKP